MVFKTNSNTKKSPNYEDDTKKNEKIKIEEDEVDPEEELKKENYRRLSNSLQSIVYSLDDTNNNIENIKKEINTNVKFNDRGYDEDTIDDINNNIFNIRNKLASIANNMKYKA